MRPGRLPALALGVVFTSVPALCWGRATRAVIDGSGAGPLAPLARPSEIAMDGSGNLYVAGGDAASDTPAAGVFKIEPDGTITRIVGPDGDGAGHVLQCYVAPCQLAVGAAGDVYVGGFVEGALQPNVLHVDPAGVITLVMDASGDGLGHLLGGVRNLALDTSGNLYVGGDSVFKVTPGGTVTHLGEARWPEFAFDAAQNLFVRSLDDRVFKVTPGGSVTTIVQDATAPGGFPLLGIVGLAVTADGTVYVSGRDSNNVLAIAPGGGVTQLIDVSGDGAGHPLEGPWSIAVDGAGAVYVGAVFSGNVFRVAGGTITEALPASGELAAVVPLVAAIDALNNAYVVGFTSGNVLRISPGGQVVEILDQDGDGAQQPLGGPWAIVVPDPAMVFVSATGSENVFRVDLRCTPAPRAGCVQSAAPASTKLLVKNGVADDRDQVSWKWTKGMATAALDLGDPTLATDYSLCLYDGGSGALLFEGSALAGGSCRGAPCWRPLTAQGATVGFKYVDADTTPDGVRTLAVRAGADGRAKLVVKARGAAMQHLPLPLTLPVTAQGQASDGGCWEASYLGTGVQQNDASRFVGFGAP